MSRGKEYVMRHDTRVINLQQVLLDDKMLAPQRDQILLHRRARWTVSEEAAHTAIDLKRLPKVEATLDKIIEIRLG